MADFQLDTSGAVAKWPLQTIMGTDALAALGWPDLSPFAQGYVEAALRDLDYENAGKTAYFDRRARFADLAPETLAAMLKDCERWQAWALLQGADERQRGADLWNANQRGWCRDFPPLALYLGDDGRVYQREGAR